MDLASVTKSNSVERMGFLKVLLVLIKVGKAISYFVMFDLLRTIHTLTLLLALKLTAAFILTPLQKPFSGPKISISQRFKIAKYSLARIFIDALWIEGLFLCGAFRFILLFEQSELIVLAAASTLIFGSSSTKKVRGTVFFIIGVICVIFFDHDSVHSDLDHPEGVHKSLLTHRLYELFINFGLSDHKIGVVVLIFAVCLDAGLAALSRSLVASIGGAKRLYSLSALLSLVILIPLILFNQIYNINSFSVQEQSDLSNIDEKIGMFNLKIDNKINQTFTEYHWFLLLIIISLINVLDYYMTSLISGRLGSHYVAYISKMVIIFIGLLLSLFWSSSTGANFFSFTHFDHHSPIPTHQLSAGVLVATVCTFYASTLLTASKSGYGPDGNSSGHFIGYSMAGLPLFTAGNTPSHGLAGLSNSGETGIWFHVQVTLKGILNGQASRRIFAFLCLNLAFTFVELFYGVWTNSLGLISDGFHMLFDSAALIVGLYAAVVSHWKPTRIFSFGYHSAEILSGFVNALFLLIISASIFVNAVSRIHRPPDIKTDRLMVVSIAGLLVNLMGIVALGHAHSHGGGSCSHEHSQANGHSHESINHSHTHSHHKHKHCEHGSHNNKHSLTDQSGLHYGHVHGEKHQHGSHKFDQTSSEDANLRGVYLHVLADTLGSVSVIFSSFLVSNYGWNIADPICSVFLACIIGYSAMPLLSDTLNLLTLCVPQQFQSQLLVQKILEFDEVLAVQNLFVWSHTHSSVCIALTVRIKSDASEQIVLSRIKEFIRTHFGNKISHLTIQVEKEDFEYHTQAMGLQLTIVSKFPKSMTNHHNLNPHSISTNQSDLHVITSNLDHKSNFLNNNQSSEFSTIIPIKNI